MFSPNQNGEFDRERSRCAAEEIARLIHHLDGCFAIGDADMDMQAEDEVSARDLLHVLDDGRVTLMHR